MPSDNGWPAGTFEDWAVQAEKVIASRLYHRLRIRQRDLHADATQHALMKAYEQGAAKFSEYGDFVRWTVTVATNDAITRIRKHARENAVLQELAAHGAASSSRGLCPAVQRCLRQVSNQNRRILEMRYECGYTYAQIGRELFSDSSPKTSDEALGQRVRRLVDGALAELRALLLADDVDPDLWPRPELA